MENMDFGTSKRAAIKFLRDLLNENLDSLRETVEEDEREDFLKTPEWKDFTWFYKMKCGKIIEGETKLFQASWYQKLSRKISFYGYNYGKSKGLLAEVWLIGSKSMSCTKGHPTFWKVAKVGYRLYYNGTQTVTGPNWQECTFTEEQSRITMI
jgi:hypothetical protein